MNNITIDFILNRITKDQWTICKHCHVTIVALHPYDHLCVHCQNAADKRSEKSKGQDPETETWA